MLRQEQRLIAAISLSAGTIAAIRGQIQGCETCSTQAALRLAELVVRLTGRHDSTHDCVVFEDIHCPSCISLLDLDTLVEVRTGAARAAVAALSA
jgi:hypothetical protein